MTGRGPVRVYGGVTLAAVRGADRADRVLDHLVRPALGQLGRGQPHAVLPGRVRRRRVAGAAVPAALHRLRRRRARRGGRGVRVRDADQDLPGLARRRRRRSRALRAPFDYWNAIGLMAAIGRAAEPVARRAARRATRWPARSPTRRSRWLIVTHGAGLLARRAARRRRGRAAVVRRSCRCACARVAVLAVSGVGAAIILWWALNQAGLTADHIPLVDPRRRPAASSACC